MGQKNSFLKNEPERLLKTKDRGQKTNPNKPKNKAEKLLKTRNCGKNEAKNKADHVVENKGQLKNEPKTNRRICRPWPSPFSATLLLFFGLLVTFRLPGPQVAAANSTGHTGTVAASLSRQVSAKSGINKFQQMKSRR
jgi:hypothetical protein